MNNDKCPMIDDKWSFLPHVAFVLFNLRKHPIEFTRGNLDTAEFADSHGVYFQRRATVRAIKVSSGRGRFGFCVANKRPIFTPLSQIFIGSSYDFSVLIHCVVITPSKDAQRD